MSKKAGRKKRSKKADDSVESSALAKTLQDFAAKQNRKPVTLSLDSDIYQSAQDYFGKGNVSTIVEAALKDILAKIKEEKKKTEEEKKKDEEGD